MGLVKAFTVIVVLLGIVCVTLGFAGDRFFVSGNRVLNPGECDEGSPVCIVRDYEIVKDGKTYLVQEIGYGNTVICNFVMIMEKMPDGRYKYIGVEDCPTR